MKFALQHVSAVLAQAGAAAVNATGGARQSGHDPGLGGVAELLVGHLLQHLTRLKMRVGEEVSNGVDQGAGHLGLVQQRQQGLLSINDAEYLQSLAQADLEAQAAHMIEEIQAINKRLSELAEISRDKVASDLRQSTKAMKAIDAYGR